MSSELEITLVLNPFGLKQFCEVLEDSARFQSINDRIQCIIKEVMSSTQVLLSTPNGKDLGRWHVSQLKSVL